MKLKLIPAAANIWSAKNESSSSQRLGIFLHRQTRSFDGLLALRHEVGKLIKIRLDQLLVEKGVAPSRNSAQAMILAGEVTSESRKLDKPGMMVDPDLGLQVRQRPRFVSRAGEKLASVAEELGLDFAAKTVLDVGSSTGGFTDYCLQHGASKVYAVDVGNNQLDFRLRQDERVIVMERTNIREAQLPEKVDLALVDVSFVSLTKILDSVELHIKPEGLIAAMAKPQFEAGKPLADKYKGVILEPERSQVLAEFEDWLAGKFQIERQINSGVSGVRGNLERFYLLKARR